MNKRTVKRVKDPKACKGCENCVEERNIGRPSTYYCSKQPIKAGNSRCEIIRIPQDTSMKPPYQVFIKVNDDGNGMPSIVLRNVDEKAYPADLVKIDGAVAEELNGWKIADAINVRPALESKATGPCVDPIGNDFIAAYLQLEDVVNLNEEMASESAVTLISTALNKLKVCAEYLGINLE